jgi:aryl-alcohol dehydrogenase-like predicted oxidoreductase
MQVSVLGFGGAEIGYEDASPETVEQLLGSALDAELNVIDTAECYADSEEKIGRALSGRRDQYYLFTKCGHAAGFDRPDWDLQLLEQSIDRSLKRLQTDCVDLIHLHTCSEELLRRGEVIEVLQKARDAGKTRFIGYSGDSEAALYAVQSGAFDTLQTSINIADQEAIDLTIPVAQEKGMGVIAKRPIANAAWRFNLTSTGNDSPPFYWRPYLERLKELNYDFLNGDLRQSIATALRFTLTVPGVSTAIVGTTKPDRWHQNAELLEHGVLSEAEFKTIRDHWRSVAKPDWIGQG